MNELHRYLNAATRGLPGGQRQRVREELLSSILERTAEHELTLPSKAEALAVALREFGNPAPVAAGMRRLYLWPKVGMYSSVAMAGLAFLAVITPQQAQAQVAPTTIRNYLGQLSSLITDARDDLRPGLSDARRAEVCAAYPKLIETLRSYNMDLVNKQRAISDRSHESADSLRFTALVQGTRVLGSLEEGVKATCDYPTAPLAASVSALSVKVAQLEVDEAGRLFTQAEAQR